MFLRPGTQMAPSTTLPSPARNKKGRQSSSAPHREVLVGASIMLVSSTRFASINRFYFYAKDTDLPAHHRWRFSSYVRVCHARRNADADLRHVKHEHESRGNRARGKSRFLHAHPLPSLSRLPPSPGPPVCEVRRLGRGKS